MLGGSHMRRQNAKPRKLLPEAGIVTAVLDYAENVVPINIEMFT